MTNKEWQAAFGETPEEIRRCVAHALEQKNKEETKMKKAATRTLILSVALILVTTCAAFAATKLGLTDFLRLSSLDGIQHETPELIWVQENDLVDAQIREAACDGISAHIVVAYTAKQPGDALLMDFDENKADIAFANERENKRVLLINSMELQAMPDGDILNTGIQWDYEAPETLVVDYSVYLCPDILAHSEDFTVSSEPWTLRFAPRVYESLDQPSDLQFEMTLAAKPGNYAVYRAVNMPLQMDQYHVNAAALVATDMACYLSVEVEDDPGMEETPLHGSYWLHALDEQGQSVPLLNGGEWIALGEDDEVQHFVVRESMQAFQPGDSLTIQPYDSHAQIEYPQLVLELEQEP